MTSKEWKKCKIGELCNSVSDTHKRNDKKVILINTSDVFDGKILNNIPIENKNLKGQFKKTFKKDDILYSEIRPANRRFAYVNIGNTDNYIASTKLMVLRPNKNKILPKYLYLILKSDEIIKELQHLAETRSGTFPQITFNSELANIEIFLPPLVTQDKIAHILSSLDDKIELNNNINQNLEQQAQAIFKSWFVDFENPKRKTCKAEEYFSISIGKTPPRKEPEWFSLNSIDKKWVSISDMGNCGVFILNSSEYLKDSAIDKFNIVLVPKDTVILSFKLTVGRVAITNEEMTTNEAIAHFKTDNKKIKEYLYCYLKNYNFQTMGSTSSIATAVNSKIIKSMPFIIPTDDEIEKFHQVAKFIFEKIRINQIENEKLKQLRDTLLPKLMSGEIDVDKINLSKNNLFKQKESC